MMGCCLFLSFLMYVWSVWDTFLALSSTLLLLLLLPLNCFVVPSTVNYIHSSSSTWINCTQLNVVHEMCKRPDNQIILTGLCSLAPHSSVGPSWTRLPMKTLMKVRKQVRIHVQMQVKASLRKDMPPTITMMILMPLAMTKNMITVMQLTKNMTMINGDAFINSSEWKLKNMAANQGRLLVPTGPLRLQTISWLLNSLKHMWPWQP